MSAPVFKFNRIYLGEGAERWSITDPESEALHEAAHKARYNSAALTRDDLLLLSTVVHEYCVLTTGNSWYSIKTSTDMIREIIKANRNKEEP